MIQSKRFLNTLQSAGYRFFSGVPCSYLTALIDELSALDTTEYIPATNEGDAIAIAAGAHFCGRPSVVFFQNSGLGNAINPLTSLAWTFKVPLLIVTTWRGQPGAQADEPQHDLMGAATPEMLDAMRIPWCLVPNTESELAHVLEKAAEHFRRAGTPYALIARKGTIGDGPGPSAMAPPAPIATLAAPRADCQPLAPDEALAAIVASTEDAAVLTTTGFTGRALYAQSDRPNHLYMVGSMGCISSLGLGIAATLPKRRVVAIDGDGAFLMRLGALATIGRVRPKNLLHVLLDNGVHDSTGAQPTVSDSTHPVGIALACGYPRAFEIDGVEMLEAELRATPEQLTFLHVRTTPRGKRALPRPHIQPPEVAQRLSTWLQQI